MHARSSIAAATSAEPRRDRASDRRGRHAMGRRGQGQLVDLVAKETHRGRPLPGRPQRRPHARGRRRDVRAAAHPERDPPRPHHAASSATAWSSTPRSCSTRSTRSRPRASTARRLRVSPQAHLVMPYHPVLDELTEAPARASTSWAPPGAASAPPTPTRRLGSGLRVEDLLDADDVPPAAGRRAARQERRCWPVYGHARSTPTRSPSE